MTPMKTAIILFLLTVGLLVFKHAHAADKLLQPNDFTYLGAFRVPQGDLGGPQYHGLNYGGAAIAYFPAHNSLFILGHDWDQLVAEISIPVPVKTSDIDSMNTATVLQNLSDITEGNLDYIGTNGQPLMGNANKIGGLLVYGSRLIGSVFAYYDAAHQAVLSPFTSGLALAASGDFAGMYQVGSSPSVPQAGFVAGYMGSIPSAYQSSLGGTTLTGQADLSIIGRSSWGPSAFSFDPGRLGSDKPVTAAPLVYYPIDHQTLGKWGATPPPDNAPNQYVALGDDIAGIVFPPGTRSILFTGRHGSGESCYGIGTDDPALAWTDVPDAPGVVYCYDPLNGSKGGHAYPYSNYVWAYDVNDFTAVKKGLKNPWDIAPYAVWSFPLPTQELSCGSSGAAAYDETNRLLYLVQYGADSFGYSVLPLIHVFLVNTGVPSPDRTPPAAPTALAIK